jgi:hypothetical protein
MGPRRERIAPRFIDLSSAARTQLPQVVASCAAEPRGAAGARRAAPPSGSLRSRLQQDADEAMKIKHGLLVALMAVALAVVPATSTAEAPIARAAATCADYPNQAAAQDAADTSDPDGDGIYCVISPR